MTTYYVSTSGNDGNAGTIGSPFRTVVKGYSVLVAGDTLYIRAGTYAEPLGFPGPQLPHGSSWGNPITIGAYSGEAVTLGRGVNVSSGLGNFYVIVQDLRFNTLAVGAGGAFIGSHYIRMQRCDIGPWGIGVSENNGLQITGNHNEILLCNVHADNNGSARSHGFYIAGSDNLVDHCLVHHCPGLGIQQYHFAAFDSSNNIIRYNKVYNNGGSDNTTGILLSSGTGNVAYGNIVYGNIGAGTPGIGIDYRGVNCAIYNNTVYGNPGVGIFIYDSDPSIHVAGALIHNNIVYNNGGLAIDNTVGAAATLANNTTTDPGFVNAGGGNFHLTGATASGTNLNSVFTADYDGVTWSPSWGRGAFKYAGAASPVVVPVVTGAYIRRKW